MAFTSTQLILETIVSGSEKAVAQIKSINTTLTNVGNSMVTFGKNATLYLTAPIVAAGGYMLKAASDAVETQNKFEAVFGSLKGEAEKFADTLGSSVNRNVTDLKNGLSSFQAFAVGMGYAGEEAIKVSTNLQALSLDFASFYNISDDEALQRFISAMSGSSEVLDRFGVNIKQSALDLELQSLGLAKGTTQANELQKAQARLSIITKTLTKQGVVGDAIKTADSYANQLKGLQGDVKTLAETMGAFLIPKAREVISIVRGLVERFQALPSGIQETILNVGMAAAALGPLSIVLGSVLKVVALLLSPIGLLVGGISALAAAFGYAYTQSEGFRNIIDSVFSTVEGIVTNVLNTLKGVITSFFDFFTGVTETFSGFFSDTFSSIASELRDWGNIVSGIFQNVSAVVTPIVRAITDFLKSIWSETKDVLGSIFKVLFYPLEIAVRTIYGIVKAVMQLMSGDMEGAWNTMKDTAQRVFTATLNLVTSIWELIKNVFKLAIATVTSLFERLWTGLVGAVKSLGQGVIDAISGIWKQIVDGFTGLIDQAFQWGANLIKGFVKGIKSIPGEVAEAASSVARTVKNFLGFSSPTEKGPGADSDTWAPNFVNMFADGLRNSATKLSGALGPMAGMLEGATAGGFGGVGGSVRSPFTGSAGGASTGRQVNIAIKIDTMVGEEAFSRKVLDGFVGELKRAIKI